MVISNQALIFQIQRMSTEDGPGIRTTVFFKQCPLKCVWCHNPESILAKKQLEWLGHKCIGCKSCIEICPNDALTLDESGMHIDRDKCEGCGACVEECPSTALHMWGELWSLNDLYHEIQKDKVYYAESKGGITVSGGEPTLQPDFIRDFLNKCKENDINTALDTCGIANWTIYEKILPFTDLILLDIKEMDDIKHKQFTGVSNKTILDNAIKMANYVAKEKKQLWIRTPLIPYHTATEENVKKIGDFIINELKNIPERWDLLSFNNLCTSKYQRLDMDWPLKDIPLMRTNDIEKLFCLAQSTGAKNVHWSGLTKKNEN